MGNRNQAIFLRQNCQLPGVRLNFYTLQNRGTPNSGRENADRTLNPDKNVTHVEGSESHGRMAQISEDLSR
jgi:hypothetical protein